MCVAWNHLLTIQSSHRTSLQHLRGWLIKLIGTRTQANSCAQQTPTLTAGQDTRTQAWCAILIQRESNKQKQYILRGKNVDHLKMFSVSGRKQIFKHGLIMGEGLGNVSQCFPARQHPHSGASSPGWRAVRIKHESRCRCRGSKKEPRLRIRRCFRMNQITSEDCFVTLQSDFKREKFTQWTVLTVLFRRHAFRFFSPFWWDGFELQLMGKWSLWSVCDVSPNARDPSSRSLRFHESTLPQLRLYWEASEQLPSSASLSAAPWRFWAEPCLPLNYSHTQASWS